MLNRLILVMVKEVEEGGSVVCDVKKREREVLCGGCMFG